MIFLWKLRVGQMGTQVVCSIILTQRVRDNQKFKFQNQFSVKARAFFKSVKFQKDLIQPIRDYINLFHEDYMKIHCLMDWRLDNLLVLNNQDFIDEIETLPLHFGVAQWKFLYNDEKDCD